MKKYLICLATAAFVLSIASVGLAADGAALYADNCEGCHGPLASLRGKGATAIQIQNAINANRGGMGQFKTLTQDQVAAIEKALGGTGQYGGSCAVCHYANGNVKPGFGQMHGDGREGDED